jgi:hypothetical protein
MVMPQSPPPFVLLHHLLPEGDHWDLCLDQGDTLATWQLMEDPTGPGSGAAFLPARRIQDHRRAYLEYEGPVSGNRGEVVRIDRGPYVLLERQPRRWVFQLAGSILIGTYELASTGDSDEWRLRPLPAA